jgi:undecaprenyl-diphosphatase
VGVSQFDRVVSHGGFPDRRAAWLRVGIGLAGVSVTAAAVQGDRVGPGEKYVFRLINELPDDLIVVVWPVMQLGALAAVPTVAGAAWASGERRLAAHLLAAGTASWLVGKAVKRIVRRPRPAALLPSALRRGREASGMGFVSGHSAVVTALAAGVLRRCPRRRALAAVLVPTVGLARIYVGAHLPLDVLGGIALGIAVDAALTLPVRDGACR